MRLKPDGTRWRTGGEMKGKLANGVGSQSPSHRFTLPRNKVYPALLPLMRTPQLPAVDWTDAPADLNGLVLFAERPNLVSARVPSRFKRTLQVSFIWGSWLQKYKVLKLGHSLRNKLYYDSGIIEISFLTYHCFCSLLGHKSDFTCFEYEWELWYFTHMEEQALNI